MAHVSFGNLHWKRTKMEEQTKQPTPEGTSPAEESIKSSTPVENMSKENNDKDHEIDTHHAEDDKEEEEDVDEQKEEDDDKEKDNDEQEDDKEEEEEGGKEENTAEDDLENKQKPLNIDLSSMKTLYQFRSRPTLPYLLTEYGMEDKGAPALKKEKEKKKKKKRSFGDDSGRDKEKEQLLEERHLQVLEDMKKLRDYYYDDYTTKLQNKVDKQRHQIRQHTKLMQNKMLRAEEKARKESHHVKKRLERHTFVSDDSFLHDLPKSDLFYIVQLQDRLIREGTLKSQTDFDIFWQRIQQPEIFYMYFKVPKSDDLTIRQDFNDNASSRGASTWKGSASTLRSIERRDRTPPPVIHQKEGGPRALSRIAESRESSRPGTRVGQHWAITQQFPSQHREPREKRRSSFTGLKSAPVQQKSSYLHDLEKRFPKLEMPKLHCFTMDLGPKAPDPEEVRHQVNLRELEKNRKKYTYKLNKMHQLSMANAAAASRILELHEDMDFIINGAPLTDLISDQYFYSGLPPPRSAEGPSSSSPIEDKGASRQYTLASVQEQEEQDAAYLQSRKSSCKSGSGKSRKSRKGKSPKPEEAEPAAPLPLSLVEVVDKTHIVEAKCLSTLWTNYMKDVPAASS